MDIYINNCATDGQKYIFLDEIQYAKDWNNWLKVFYDQNKNWSIVATGSASPLIERGITESGVGRWITITVPTLSFYEYCRLIDEKSELDTEDLIEGIKKLPEDTNSSVIICDIDFFKKVNDTYGHNVGDAVLVHVADLLQKNVEGIGEVSRWGGEEFVILLPKLTVSEAVAVAEDIRTKVQASQCECQNVVVKVTMSFGVSALARTKTSTENIKIADENLYRAKEEGRNRVIWS